MAWNIGDEVQFGGGECHGALYITHILLPCGRSRFYNDLVECLPVDSATWVRFPAGTGKYFRSTTYISETNVTNFDLHHQCSCQIYHYYKFHRLVALF